MPTGMYDRKKPKMSDTERKAKASKHQRRYYANNEEYRRQQKNLKLQKAYGITLEQYETWNAVNSGLCHICNKAEIAFDKKSGKVRLLAVDHDNKTGIVRGLLCSVCNRAIGMLRHNPTIMAEAIDYINYFNNVTMPGVQSAINS